MVCRVVGTPLDPLSDLVGRIQILQPQLNQRLAEANLVERNHALHENYLSSYRSRKLFLQNNDIPTE